MAEVVDIEDRSLRFDTVLRRFYKVAFFRPVFLNFSVLTMKHGIPQTVPHYRV